MHDSLSPFDRCFARETFPAFTHVLEKTIPD